MARRKYQKGDTITTLGELVSEITAGRSVFIHDKVQNAAWLQNMNLHTLHQFILAGAAHRAIDDYPRPDSEGAL